MSRLADGSNPLHLSWHDSSWLPFLNPTNVLDYFSDKSNSFYDRSCNNEIIKMQRQSMDQLKNMVGTEYILLHVKEPILYVVRKQHRHSPEETTPLADYYIIAGRVYQAPDLASVFNSRILNTVHHLQQAFDDANSFARYHPGKGYSWDFSSSKLGKLSYDSKDLLYFFLFFLRRHRGEERSQKGETKGGTKLNISASTS